MRYAQEYYKKLLPGVLLAVLMAAADAGSILNDNAPGPCDPGLAAADVTPGVDVNGNPVAPADLPAGPVNLSGSIEVPVKAGRGRAPAYVTVDGAKLGTLMNTAPGCAAPKPH